MCKECAVSMALVVLWCGVVMTQPRDWENVTAATNKLTAKMNRINNTAKIKMYNTIIKFLCVIDMS